MAETVAQLARRAGLDAHIEQTPGPPLVLASRAGRASFTLLLYHHYDCTPPGPWRAWDHEPFQLAERDGALFGRGVAHGKGPLLAHLHALHTLLEHEGELPCNVVLLAEGEGLSGSAQLGPALAQHRAQLRADACLATAGSRDVNGLPFCYTGCKGLLQVLLRAEAAREALPAGLATIVRNPIWRLVGALASLKGDDEEIKIAGFYDDVAGPSRRDNTTLRQTNLDEAGRLSAWGLPAFLFDMSGPALSQAEVTLPTCNITSVSAGPASDLPLVPTSAQATLDMQLVPEQQPARMFELLQQHLQSRQFTDVEATALPGGYGSAVTDYDHPLVQHLACAGEIVFGSPLQVLPAGSFALPLRLLAEALELPTMSLALARASSAIHGPNEHLPLDDLLQHAAVLMELLRRVG
jgi:acetylornithine deacetylase/succinyl-diaminopimelate desuccinylase-like protein